MIRRQRLNKVKLRGTSYGVWVQNQKNHEVHFLKLNSKCKVGSWVRSEIRSNRWETVFKLRGTGSDTQGSFRGNQRVACSGRKPNTWTSLWEESGNRPWGASGIRGSLWLFLISMCTHQKLVVDRVQVLMGTDQIGVFAVKPKLVFAAVKIIQATHQPLLLSASLQMWLRMADWHAERDGVWQDCQPLSKLLLSFSEEGWAPSGVPTVPQQQRLVTYAKPRSRQQWMAFLGPNLQDKTGWLMKPGAGTVIDSPHHTVPWSQAVLMLLSQVLSWSV